MALRLAHPLYLAAIDAGSNAFRLIIARLVSTEGWEVVETQRAPVRLGHTAFTTGKFDRQTLRAAGAAFRLFRRTLDRYNVTAYRAVATSAAREARNRHLLIERVRLQSGINLEVISGEEEARLVRVASLRALRSLQPPRFILDLGGGSLELNELRRGGLRKSIGLPIGTVRLMEAFHIQGAIHESAEDDLRRHVRSILQTALPNRPHSTSALAVACGGNAETLAGLAPGPRLGGMGTLNARLLRERLWQILKLDVEGRMYTFGVRRDRAEVMGVAAIVLDEVDRWLRLNTMITPRVGVREGLLDEVAATLLSPARPTDEQRKQAQIINAGAETFACKVLCDLKHSKQVRRLAVRIFDQLWPLHRLSLAQRAILEAAATLHDAGHFVNRKAHHRHSEYLVRNAKIPGLRGWAKNMVASLVRYHNGKAEPNPAHESYAALNRARRKQTRILAGILRLAERLESDHRQAITLVTIEGGPRAVRVHVELSEGQRLNLAGIERKSRLLERELNLQFTFHRVQIVEKAAVA